MSISYDDNDYTTGTSRSGNVLPEQKQGSTNSRLSGKAQYFLNEHRVYVYHLLTSFVVSESFSVVGHIGRFKPGSKPA